MLPIGPKFALGRLLVTGSALKALEESGQSPIDFICRHVRGDYGEICREDKRLNEQALINEGRILSSYKTLKGAKIWIITEADRSATTLLLPSEY
ncbi:MAG: hypothetical protein GXX96_17305 [Planctomycetaceae bacterium]|nr:hypothetical protein [Planctomycetaceae bacterium]